jgi:hypothetical protein
MASEATPTMASEATPTMASEATPTRGWVIVEFGKVLRSQQLALCCRVINIADVFSYCSRSLVLVR